MTKRLSLTRIFSYSYDLLKQKIEKLQSGLHLLEDEDDSRPTNQHIVFVDTEREGGKSHHFCM